MEKTDDAMFSAAVKSCEVQNQRENQVVKFGDKLNCRGKGTISEIVM